MNQKSENKNNFFKKQNSLRDFRANMNCTDICIVEVPE